MNIGNFLISFPGLCIVLLFKMLLASLSICGSIELFDFKKNEPFLAPFFTFKRVASFFLLIFGLRLLFQSVLSFPGVN